MRGNRRHWTVCFSGAHDPTSVQLCICVLVSRVMSPKHKHGEILDSLKFIFFCIISCFYNIHISFFKWKYKTIFHFGKLWRYILIWFFLSVIILRCYSKQQIKQCVNTKCTHCISKVLCTVPGWILEVFLQCYHIYVHTEITLAEGEDRKAGGAG